VTLWHRSLTPETLTWLTEAPATNVAIDVEQRSRFAAHLRAVPTVSPRRLDAWMVEHPQQAARPFAWSPTTARRLLGGPAAQRVLRDHVAPRVAVSDIVADYLLLVAQEPIRRSSLGSWLARQPHPVVGMVIAEATNWATQLVETLELLGPEWSACTHDAYYAVSGAQTTLRGRRDLTVGVDHDRVVVRLQSGRPSASAGAGLRTDLLIDTLAHPKGLAPRRYVGLWPDAGLVLAVDGTVENLRAGGRCVVRAAVAQRRRELAPTA